MLFRVLTPLPLLALPLSLKLLTEQTPEGPKEVREYETQGDFGFHSLKRSGYAIFSLAEATCLCTQLHPAAC